MIPFKRSLAFLLLTIAFCSAASAQEKPILRLDSGGHMGTVRGVVFSPDGREVFTAGEDKTIQVWDTRTGRRLRVLRSWINGIYEGYIYALDISPDGKKLASAGWYKWTDEEIGIIRILDSNTGAVERLLSGHESNVSDLAFSPDGRTLASASADDTVILWDVESWSERARLRLHKADVTDVSWSPDGAQLASVGDDGIMYIWDSETGNRIRASYISKERQDANAVCEYSPDGSVIAVATEDGRVDLWDADSLAVLKTIREDHYAFSSLRFTPTTGRLAMAGDDRFFDDEKDDVIFPVYLHDFVSAEEVGRVGGNTAAVTTIAISGDGTLAASAGGSSNEIALWNPENQEVWHVLRGHGRIPKFVGFGNDNKSLYWGYDLPDNPFEKEGPQAVGFSFVELDMISGFKPTKKDYQLSLNVFGGKAIRIGDRYRSAKIEVNGNPVKWTGPAPSSTFSIDGENAFIAHFADIYTINSKDGSYDPRVFEGHEGAVASMAPSPDGKMLVTASYDMTFRIWNIETAELLATLFVSNDDEWAMWTPSGYYRSSLNGARYIGWHINRGIDESALYYPLEQFSAIYDRPDIVEQTLLLGSEEKGIAAANAVSGRDHVKVAPEQILEIRPPEIVFLSPENNSTLDRSEVSVAYRIDSPLDIEEIHITLNGRQLERTRALAPVAHEKLAGPGELLTIRLEPGENVLSIFAAHEKANARASLYLYGPEPVVAAVAQAPEEEAPPLPRLFVLAIGVDQYDNFSTGSQLDFPDDDAREVAEVFRQTEGKLFSEVRTMLIAGAERPPTRDLIVDSLVFFHEATQYDTCVLFVAGHGVQDRRGTYYFVPKDGEFHERDGELEPRPSSMVLWSTFRDALDVPGRKIFMLDTCHSESASGANRRKADTTQMLKELRDESTVILTAARGNQYAIEREEWGHGAFTKAILDGLRGRQADRVQDGDISIEELDAYISESVPRLTEWQQQPITFAPEGIGSHVIYR